MIVPLKRYADFAGRSRRMEYWMYALLNMAVLLILGGVALASYPWSEVVTNNAAGKSVDYAPAPTPGPIFWVAIGLVTIWWLINFIPTIAVVVRRLHDQDKSGWLYLLSFIPYVGPLVIVVFMFMDGTRGTNQYGPDPKGGSADIFA